MAMFPTRVGSTFGHEFSDPSDHEWVRPTQQKNTEEILQSIERLNLTSVYGTSSPPSKLSGALRRYAFRFSEGRFRHWLMLLLADRINMVEGMADDVSQGHGIHYLEDHGFNAQWRHDTKAVIGRVAMGAVVIGAFALLLRSSKR